MKADETAGGDASPQPAASLNSTANSSASDDDFAEAINAPLHDHSTVVIALPDEPPLSISSALAISRLSKAFPLPIARTIKIAPVHP